MMHVCCYYIYNAQIAKSNWQKILEERAIKGLKKLENEKILRVAPMGFNFFMNYS